jgi:hypothetical protein
MRAWQLLVDTLGEANIPMATEAYHEKYLRAIMEME